MTVPFTSIDKLYIGGEWAAPAEGEREPVLDPATQEIIGMAPVGSCRASGRPVSWLTNPESQGEIRIAPADPDVAPVVTAKHFSVGIDRLSAVSLFRWLRALGRQPALARWIVEETSPVLDGTLGFQRPGLPPGARRLLLPIPENLPMSTSESLLNVNLVYSSPRMFERRRRILDTTRQLVADRGYEGFSIRDVCQLAEVAPQTIYKAFESKERLVALAIRHHYQAFAEQQHYHHDTSTLQGVIERLIVNDVHMRKLRPYVSALVAIYFSQTADQELRTAASHTAMTSLDAWAIALREGGHVRRGLSNENLVKAVVSALFSVSLDWCRGQVADHDFIVRKVEVLLVTAAGATRGAAQKEVSSTLTDLLGPRRLFDALVMQAGHP